MNILQSDYILGIVGADMVPPTPEKGISPLKAMTVCMVCLRRKNTWLAFIEFLYSDNDNLFSPDDERRVYPVPLLDVRDNDEMWEFVRSSARGAFEHLAYTLKPKEIRELRVDGNAEKLSLLLATSPDPLLRTFAEPDSRN